MKILNVIMMMLWCLFGIMQIMNPSPYAIFLDIVLILWLIFAFDQSQQGWGRALKGWERSIQLNARDIAEQERNVGDKNG